MASSVPDRCDIGTTNGSCVISLPRSRLEMTAWDQQRQDKNLRDGAASHSATFSVFQRKRQELPQYQQTRGTLPMLTQWDSLAAQKSFQEARREPLITLGPTPLGKRLFSGVVLVQPGESRLDAAIMTGIAGDQSHSKVLDADTKGPLRDIVGSRRGAGRVENARPRTSPHPQPASSD